MQRPWGEMLNWKQDNVVRGRIRLQDGALKAQSPGNSAWAVEHRPCCPSSLVTWLRDTVKIWNIGLVWTLTCWGCPTLPVVPFSAPCCEGVWKVLGRGLEGASAQRLLPKDVTPWRSHSCTHRQVPALLQSPLLGALCHLLPLELDTLLSSKLPLPETCPGGRGDKGPP